MVMKLTTVIVLVLASELVFLSQTRVSSSVCDDSDEMLNEKLSVGPDDSSDGGDTLSVPLSWSKSKTQASVERLQFDTKWRQLWTRHRRRNDACSDVCCSSTDTATMTPSDVHKETKATWYNSKGSNSRKTANKGVFAKKESEKESQTTQPCLYQDPYDNYECDEEDYECKWTTRRSKQRAECSAKYP